MLHIFVVFGASVETNQISECLYTTTLGIYLEHWESVYVLTAKGLLNHLCHIGLAEFWRGRRSHLKPQGETLQPTQWQFQPPLALTRTPHSARRGTTSSHRHGI